MRETLTAHTERLSKFEALGTKKASFFLRDVALLEGLIDAECSRHVLLQPIDVWVRRMVTELDRTLAPSAVDEDVAISATRICAEIVNPLLFNAGAWYFASQVVGLSLTSSKQCRIRLK
jgi:hypothetical protein